MKNDPVPDYLIEQEKIRGIKLVREDCKRYLLKKAYGSAEYIKRKPIPRSWVVDAYALQSSKCSRCGNHMEISEAVGDHKVPLALNGAHNKHNIAACHRSCNASKGANDFVKESKLQQTGQTRVPIEEEA